MKKLLGERQIGDVVYEQGKLMTDAEAEATGLPATDFQNVANAGEEAPSEQKAVAPDAQADIDAQVEEQKKDAEQSAPSGSDNTENTGEGGASTSEKTGEEGLTLDHILTEQDLLDNPEMVTAGLKVGEPIRVPAKKIILTQADLDADPQLAEAGKKVGDELVVIAEE